MAMMTSHKRIILKIQNQKRYLITRTYLVLEILFLVKYLNSVSWSSPFKDSNYSMWSAFHPFLADTFCLQMPVTCLKAKLSGWGDWLTRKVENNCNFDGKVMGKHQPKSGFRVNFTRALLCWLFFSIKWSTGVHILAQFSATQYTQLKQWTVTQIAFIV
jgi:hypothetical protein